MRTGVAGFQPERLKQARQVVGMNKTVLAKKVDRSVGTISKWESGQQSPEGASLAALSEIFQLPMHWFTRPVPSGADGAYFFRSNTTATQTARTVAEVRLQWLQELSQTFQQWMSWPALNLVDFEETDLFQITDDQIEELAETCRIHWGLGLGPVSNVIHAMESAGVICARDFIGHVKMDGVSTWHQVEGRPYVFIASDKANGIRNRFDSAHELGHLLMHQHIDKSAYQENYALIEI
ncbi:XRE family transcriptional regulator [Endozoicomonas sp. ONNA2]|uniref:helix-turn-helix domain-containing protein n=1 Tax=Endozoicomonas sp. ONNA2 TaxID=2828741 RepID=UPI002148D130|nr:XRE family transcriptional regulator [Endozoicomonas sp. ONNA2]